MTWHESWPKVLLGDVVQDITVGFVGTMADQYVAKGVRFLRSQDIEPYRVLRDTNKFVSQEFHSKLSKSSPKAGDVVIVRTGKPGTCAVIPEGFGECNCSDIVIVKPGNRVDPHYLSYFINGVATHHVESFTVGAVQQHFNVGAARLMPIPLPPLNVQKRIAHILGTLDNKIELNRRMGATLEEMARAIFKSWFIDFDPVHVKAQGRPTNRPPEVEARFPDSFEDSAWGMIPNGWSWGNIGDVATNVRSPVTTKSIRSDEPYVGLEHIDKCTMALSRWGIGSDVQSQKSRFELNHVLFGKLRPYFHKVAIAPVSGVCSTDILVVEPKLPEFQSFVAIACSEKATIEFVTATSGGTRMPRTSWSELARVPLVIPSNEVLIAFHKLASPLLSKLTNTVFEIQTLAAIRDSLLPKLISGEYTISTKNL